VGVEYRHFLLPRPNRFLPTAAQLETFLKRMIDARWLPVELPSSEVNRSYRFRAHRAREHLALDAMPSAASLAEWLDRDTKLVWSIGQFSHFSLNYPLTPLDRWQNLDEMYYDMVIEWSPDYIYRLPDGIDPFDRVVCPCGASLEIDDSELHIEEPVRDLFYTSIIRASCPACGRQADVSDWPAVVRDDKTGILNVVPGGATSRFSLIVDCGKGYPSSNRMELKPEIVALFRETFGCDSYECIEYY